jgi:hypothetical protein
MYLQANWLAESYESWPEGPDVKLSKVGVLSKVVQVRPGTITVFHAVLSDGLLPQTPLTLKDLLVPIPMVSVELAHAFGIKPLGLLLAFALASLYRYRPNLLDSIESSKISLIFDVFLNEADGFLLPAFRNLIYGELLCLHRSRFI